MNVTPTLQFLWTKDYPEGTRRARQQKPKDGNIFPKFCVVGIKNRRDQDDVKKSPRHIKKHVGLKLEPTRQTMTENIEKK